MTRRLVTANFKKTDDTPWTNLKVIFKREKNSYTPSTQYPTDYITTYTNSNGDLYSTESTEGVFLWIDEEGDLGSAYTVYLPRCETFSFRLPEGDLSPIELSALRQDYNLDTVAYNSLIAYVDGEISTAEFDNNKFVTSNNYEVGETISAAKIVALDANSKIVLADISNTDLTFKTLGISTKVLTVSSVESVISWGEFEDNSFSLTPNLPIFLGATGNLVQNPDMNQAYLITLGTALTATKILLNIEKPTIIN